MARRQTPVLILGETGTGKELVAQALHRYGGRAERPFVPLNCAAIPETLVESELFGHEKGTFTGAQTRRAGRFQEANGGTLFLDEVGELPLATQAKLLRVLQEHEVCPLGGAPVQVDVRVVAATHRDLETEIREGRFREDLFFRLNVATLFLPPLRERRSDIPDLVAHFLRRQATGDVPLGISAEALRLLEENPWPGNVRQLENAVKRASMRTTGRVIGPDTIQQALHRNGTPVREIGDPLDAWIGYRLEGNAAPALLRDLERDAIAAVLRRTGGRRVETARLLGINRKTLREKIALYGLEEPEDGAADDGV
jgi:DNA-binding NtrC family response regulator